MNNLDFALEMLDINKSFPGVKALTNVTFQVKKGEVHALVGENGAGKSTLMKILNGVFKADSGQIRIHGKEVEINNTNDAKDLGIGLIFQEFNLIPSLSVAENVYLGRLKNKASLVDWASMNKEAEKLLKSLDFNFNPRTTVDYLSVAEKQLVEIAKVLSLNANIILMDEPTATLTSKEIDKLFNIIRNLKEKGITIIYISHRLEEIFGIADTVTVLRDGEVILTNDVSKETKTNIIEKMVGRSLQLEFPPREKRCGEVVLEVKNINSRLLKDISFELHAGEILGIAGLVGSGRTELAKAVFGEDPPISGTISVKGRVRRIKSTFSAKKCGIALVPEDRKEEGLVLDFSVMSNSSICNLNKISMKAGLISKRKERLNSQEITGKLGVKTPTINQKVKNLSGGNQQKVVLAKWLFSDPEILILDEPTRGIDVGAKYEIYQLMNAMVAEGKAIIMISSELPEVLGMSDRILVMSNGRIKGTFKNEEIDANMIMKTAIG